MSCNSMHACYMNALIEPERLVLLKANSSNLELHMTHIIHMMHRTIRASRASHAQLPESRHAALHGTHIAKHIHNGSHLSLAASC